MTAEEIISESKPKQQGKSLSQEQLESQRVLADALKTYDIKFFKQFAFSGRDSLKLSQKGLEEYIQNINNSEVEKLLLAMVHQAYELNQHIPNIELVLYKIFCSPIST